jgi:uncharacterized protein
MEWFILCTASLFAGFVDSVVGGGGLILVPGLFAVFPQAAPATLFGTNKGASTWGTMFAAWQFSRRVEMRWHSVMPAVLAAALGALAGAWLVTQVSPQMLRRSLPLILLMVLAYTLYKKELGHLHQPHLSLLAERWTLVGIGAVLGLYDGFFGPGTGSFLVFALVRVLGYDFLHASAHAKLLNFATNGAALLLFALKGHVWWHLALPMALANVIGSLLGTRLALQHGTAFVRGMFIVVVAALIVKTSYDAFMR